MLLDAAFFLNREQRKTPSSFRLTLALKLQRRRTGCKARNKNIEVCSFLISHVPFISASLIGPLFRRPQRGLILITPGETRGGGWKENLPSPQIKMIKELNCHGEGWGGKKLPQILCKGVWWHILWIPSGDSLDANLSRCWTSFW